MQHTLKSKVLAAALSVMIAITFMPWYLWQTSDRVHAAADQKVTLVEGNSQLVDAGLNEGIGSVDPSGGNEYVDVKLAAKGANTAKFAAKKATQETVIRLIENSSTNPANTRVDVTVLKAIAKNENKRVGKQYYASLEEAIDDSAKNNIIELVADAEIEKDITIKNDDTTIATGDFGISGKDGKKVIKAGNDTELTVTSTGGNFANIAFAADARGAVVADTFDSTAAAAGEEYVATFKGKLYVGLKAFDLAYKAAANANEPIEIFASKDLENVPANVMIKNSTKAGLKINSEVVEAGKTYNTNATECIVIFDAQGGNLNNGAGGTTEKIYVDNNKTVERPAVDPAKTGYIFDGWYTDEVVKYQFEYETDSHKKTTSTFGAESVFKTSEGKYIIILADGTPVHNATLVNNTAYDFSQPITGNMTLYAHWLKDPAAVTFDVYLDYNGANDTAKEPVFCEKVAFGEKVKAEKWPVTPEKDGYTFDGWYNGDSKWDFNTDRVYKDLTLKAKWLSPAEDNVYRVKFDLNGGKYSETSAEKKEQLFRGAIWAAIMANDNYALEYAKELAGEGTMSAGPLKGKSYAEAIDAFVTGYTDKSRKASTIDGHISTSLIAGIDFTDGKIYSDENFYQIVEEGALVKEPNKKNLSKDDSTFVMWIDKATGEEFEFNDTFIDKDTTLVAQWKTNQYTVEFKTQGHGQGVDPIKVDKGEYIGTEPVLEEDGYIFGGWFADQTCRGTKLNLKNVKPESLDKDAKDDNYTVQLYAKWTKANTYTVEFKTQGHGQGVDPVKVAEGAYIGTEPVLEEEGYIFGGWFADQSCRGTKLNLKNVKPEDLSDNASEKDPYTVHVYAKWTKKYTVEFKTQTHGIGIDPISVAEGSYIGAVADPAIEEDGWIFEGWYDNQGCEGYKLNLKNTKPEELDSDNERDPYTVQVYAKWTEVKDSVVLYDVTSGKRVPVASIKIATGTEISYDQINDALPNEYSNMSDGIKAKVGYAFDGIYNEKAYKEDAYTKANEWDFNTTKVEGNVNVYLKYSPIEYKIRFDAGSKYATVKDGETVDGGALMWLSEQPTYTQTVVFNKETKLDACKYERAGYEFAGWKLMNTKNHEPLSGFTFIDGALINANVNEYQAEVIATPEDLYLEGEEANYVFVAQWTPLVYAVTYLPNGGEGDVYGQHLWYNDGTIPGMSNWSKTLANTFTKTGYHFIGWNTKEDGSGQWIKGSKYDAKGLGHDRPCVIYDGAQVLLKHGTIDTNLATKKPAGPIELFAQWAPCDNYSYTETTWTEIYKIESKEAVFPQSKGQAIEWAGQSEKISPLIKMIGDSWYYPTIKKCVGTTDETVKAEIPEGFELDTEHSTKDLTIVLSADKYADACVAESDVIAAANIDIVAKGIAKATAPVLPKETVLPEGQKLVYNSQQQKLVTEGKTEAGTFMYAIVPNTPEDPEWEKVEWSAEIPTAKDAGTYRVASYIKAEDEAHKDSIPTIVTSTIDKKIVGIEWGKTTFTYDGVYHVPSATATGVYPGDTCYVYVKGEKKEMGSGYVATAYALSNANYKLPEGEGLHITSIGDPKHPTTQFNIVGSILLAQATPKGKKKVNVTWTGVSGATRYDIYAINCGKTSVYQFNGAVGAGTQTVTFSKIAGKKLKAHKSYKFYVQAFAGDTLIAQSNEMHCLTAKTKGKKANPTAIYSNQGTIVIGANNIGGVSARVKLPKKKTILGVDHCVPYRYVTSDPGIATVDANGTVYGVHSGVCTVYTQTVNGMWCPTTVIVQ